MSKEIPKMGHRVRSSRSTFIALSAAAAAVSLASINLAAQSTRSKTAAKPAKAWTMPHTPDGQPDLTGNWTNAPYTPLERPVSLGTKAFYTKEEAVAVEKEG